MALTPAEIEAIADAVYRRFHLSQDLDIQKVAALPLAEQKAFWKARREDQKRGRKQCNSHDTTTTTNRSVWAEGTR